MVKNLPAMQETQVLRSASDLTSLNQGFFTYETWSISCYISKQGCHSNTTPPEQPERRPIRAVLQPFGCSHSLRWAWRRKAGHWLQIAKMYMKGMISVSWALVSSHIQKSTNFLTWDVWVSLILLMFSLFALCCKLLYNLILLSGSLEMLSPRIEVLKIPTK